VARIRSTGVSDEEEDYAVPVWCAVLPLRTVLCEPEECPHQLAGVALGAGGMAGYVPGRRFDEVNAGELRAIISAFGRSDVMVTGGAAVKPIPCRAPAGSRQISVPTQYRPSRVIASLSTLWGSYKRLRMRQVPLRYQNGKLQFGAYVGDRWPAMPMAPGWHPQENHFLIGVLGRHGRVSS
jgi:hypothetical protein